jgi:cell division protein FtsQ
MPAVVRGGRRQSSVKPQRRAGPGGRGARPASGLPAKSAALGRLDVSPRTAAWGLGAGALLLIAVLATGARAERIGASVSEGVDAVTTGMGFSLRRVKLEGVSPEARPELERALALNAGDPMLGLDLGAVRERALSVGWVADARVVRLLPNTLLVEVTERPRLAVWQVNGRAAVIDAAGQVIPGAHPGRYPGLPLVVGRGADAAAAEVLPLLGQRPRLMNRVEALVRVDERRWDLRLKDGSLIQLPALDQEAALIRLDAVDQRERLLDLGFARVDLRTPEEIAVRPRAGAAAQQSEQG